MTKSAENFSQEHGDHVLGLFAELRELFVGEQAPPFDSRDLEQRGGTAEVVEQPRQFFVALAEELVERQIPLVGAPVRFAVLAFALGQHALAVPFDGYWMQLPKNLPEAG
jgi:hypothetical protein